MGAGQLAAGQERVPGLTWRSVTCVEDVLSVLAGGWGRWVGVGVVGGGTSGSCWWVAVCCGGAGVWVLLPGGVVVVVGGPVRLQQYAWQ